MKLLVDTSVLIDYLGRKAPFYENAERIIAAGYFGQAQLWASTQSFKDAFYVLSRYVGSAQVQDALLKLFEVVNPVDLTGEDVRAAARLKWDDLEDCLIAIAAQKAGASYIVTRDKSGFTRSMVPPIDPAAWLAQLSDSEGITFSSVDL